MKARCTSLAIGAMLLASVAAPVHAGIYNIVWSRSDGFFSSDTYLPSPRPQTTILRGFCYDFDVNGDFIDLTVGLSSTDDINSLSKTRTLNGAQNSVNGHPIGQIRIHFCVPATASTGNKTIRILNFGGGEFDRLVVGVVRGGQISSFSPATARVNIPFQFTINGSDLQDATIEGNGISRVTDPSDLNTNTTLRFTLVVAPTVGAQNHETGILLRRISPPGGTPATDPGLIRDTHGNSAMIIQVTGSSPITGTIAPRPIPVSGPAPVVTASSIQDLVLVTSGKSLRRLDANGKIDEAFCQGFAVPAAGGATEKDITVPLWGLAVTNPHAGAFSGGAQAQLVGPVPAPAVVQFGALAAGGALSVPFSRPTSITRAILILPSTNAATRQPYGGSAALGCYQSAMRATDARNWTDPPYSLRLLDQAGGLIHSVGF